ncbi:MAG TPA: glycosyltransferase family 39 protein [Bacteroidales bacterium]
MKADKTNIFSKLYSPAILLVIVVLSFFSIFDGIGDSHINIWDEATYANNSIDMAFNSKNIFVVQHLNEPDFYNTKPPFVIWMQAISIRIFGINEFAIRLPSAVFGFLTVLLVYFFCSILLKSKTAGLISALILLSSKGFISYHVVRTGDLDATLVFWLTLGLFVFIHLLIIKPKKTTLHFLVLAISLIFGFLTKGIAGFFFIPFMFLISLLYKNHWIYREKFLYISAFFTLLIGTGYYMLNEWINPGYLEIVFGSEIARFNTEVMSWQIHQFDYYYQNLKASKYDAFYFFLPFTLLALPVLKTKKFRIFVYLVIAAVGYFLLISYPTVKLGWYDAPLYPLFSILIGYGFVALLSFILNRMKLSRVVYQNIIILGIAAGYLCNPYFEVLNNVKYDETNIYPPDFDGAYLRFLYRNEFDISRLTIVKKESHIEHYDQVLFYMRAYEKEKNYQIKLTQETSFQPGELLMCSNPELKEFILNSYSVDTVNSWQNGLLCRINNELINKEELNN